MSDPNPQPDDLLLWLDLETTGDQLPLDNIIEIGCVLTDFHLDPASYYHDCSFTSLVRPDPAALGRMLINRTVRAMHEANGLVREIVDGYADLPKPHEVAAQVVDWMVTIADDRQGQGNTRRVILAGSGVSHFDRRFLDRYMPQLSRRLPYWCIDTGVLRRSLFVVLPASADAVAALHADRPAKPHRALPDAHRARDEMCEIRDVLRTDSFLLAHETAPDPNPPALPRLASPPVTTDTPHPTDTP